VHLLTDKTCKVTSIPLCDANAMRFSRLFCSRMASSSAEYPLFSSWNFACIRDSSHGRNDVLVTIGLDSSGLSASMFSKIPSTWNSPWRSDSSSSLKRLKFWTSSSSKECSVWVPLEYTRKHKRDAHQCIHKHLHPCISLAVLSFILFILVLSSDVLVCELVN